MTITAPAEAITLENLDEIFHVGDVLTVRTDGTAEIDHEVALPSAIFTDTEPAVRIESKDRWTLIQGKSGQDRYDGPILHSSEHITPSWARRILATPGHHAAVEVVDERDPNALIGWVLVFRPLDQKPAPVPGTPAHPPVMRVLIQSQVDARLLEQVAGVLESAAVRQPGTFSKVAGEPGVIDHYGYQTDLLSSVVLSREYANSGALYRLTIRPGRHEVFDNLAAIVRDYYQL